jgi:hypothetical protein
MDKLAKRLHDDAARIDVTITQELDNRIEASLRAVTPEAGEPRPEPARPPLFWWASTVTGVAAAVAVIALINIQAPDETAVTPPVAVVSLPPMINLKTEAAMLTSPLEKELKNLEADLRKAEEKVKRDIGL